MLPTTQQVNEYLTTQTEPVSSKIIAQHFQCTTKDINRNRENYIGIYSNPDVVNVDYLHSIKVPVQVHVPTIDTETTTNEDLQSQWDEPEPQPLALPEPEPEKCAVCLEDLPQFPVSWGCCSAKMCSGCAKQCVEISLKCPACRTVPDFLKHVAECGEPESRAILEPEPEPEPASTRLRARVRVR